MNLFAAYLTGEHVPLLNKVVYLDNRRFLPEKTSCEKKRKMFLEKKVVINHLQISLLMKTSSLIVLPMIFVRIPHRQVL